MSADIVIVTGMAPGLGQGHVQRMSSLLARLREVHRLDVRMMVTPMVGDLPPEIAPHIVGDIGSPKLIIRDMRDSTEEEVAQLRQHAPLCVIDDRGPGRKRADHVMDILPHPGGSEGAISGSFVYGYNFLRSLRAVKKRVVQKTVDYVVYAGALDDMGVAKLESLLPDDADRFLLGKGRALYRGSDGSRAPADSGYAEMLMSSKVAITHFGVFLYEAAVSGCSLVTINPSAYHSELAEVAKRDLPVVNLGVSGEMGDAELARALSGALKGSSGIEVRCDDVERRVVESIDRCAALIRTML